MADMLNMNDETTCTYCKVRLRATNSAVCEPCSNILSNVVSQKVLDMPMVSLMNREIDRQAEQKRLRKILYGQD